MKHMGVVSVSLVILFFTIDGVRCEDADSDRDDLEEEYWTIEGHVDWNSRQMDKSLGPDIIPPTTDSCPDGTVGQPCQSPNAVCPPGYFCDKIQCCKKPPVCRYGNPGITCSNQKVCGPGYECTRGRCCSLCPEWDIGALCPDKTCTAGYDCKNGRCCKNHCPDDTGITGPQCNPLLPCQPGYTCKSGTCCAECPTGKTVHGFCYLIPGWKICRSGSECFNNLICCAPENRVCPPNDFTDVVCPQTAVRHMCTTDADCPKGLLCCKGPCFERFCTLGVEA